MRIAGIVHHHSLGGVIGIPKVLTECLAGSTGRRLKSLPARKSFPPLEPLGGPLSPILGMGGGQSKSLDSMLYGPLRLLRGGSTEDALQPRYTSPTLSLEGAGNVSRSMVTTTMFCLALAKVGSYHSTHSIAAVRPTPSIDSHWCRSASLASATVHSSVSLPHCRVASRSMSFCRTHRCSS
jgi:hypothetical protein